MQNIGKGNADDAFYRYKMPKLIAKVEGRGNGIKTNIVNNVDIAKSLDRPPEYPLKYFGCDLGAQTKFDKATGTSIVNGAHDAGKLSELLEGFIKKYVQCYSCGNPETVMKIKKEMIHLKCKACGYVSDVDMRHKLNTFIINNPPENKLSKEEKKLKKAEEDRMKDATDAERRERKEEKKKKKEEKGEDGEKKKKKDKKSKKSKDGSPEGEGSDEKDDDDDDEEEAADDDDGVVWLTDTSAEAAKLRAAEQLTAATAAMVTQGNIEAEQAAAKKKADKEAAAAAAAAEEVERLKAEEEAAAAAEAAQKLAAEADAANATVAKIRELIDSGSDAAAVAAEVKGLTVPGGLAGKMSVLYQALFAAVDAETKLADVVKAKKKILAVHSKDQPGQLAQLIALEHLLAVTCVDRGKEIALVLKALYDLDLADDEVIIAWNDKADAAKILLVPGAAAAAMRKIAAPLVEWLKEDDDDDEESDEEE